MSDRLEELPLFPLNTVLFPYAQMQVHVFEARYREMIRRCIHEDQCFGIVLIRSGSEVGERAEPYLVGTAVRIVSVQTYDDGRMDVKIQGERRFRIRQLEDSEPYLTGRIEPVVEMEVQDTPRADALMIKAREYMEAYLETCFHHLGHRVAKVRLPQDPTALSFVVANFLQIENLKKQHLLETTDTLERIAEMLPILKEHLDGLTAPLQVKLTSEQLQDWISPN